MKYEIRGASQETGEEMIFIVEARSKQIAESKALRKGMLISKISRASRLARAMDEPETIETSAQSTPEQEPQVDDVMDDEDEVDFIDAPSHAHRAHAHTSGGLMFKTFITPKIIVLLFWAVAVLLLLGVLLGTAMTFIGALSQSTLMAIVSAIIFFVVGLILTCFYILFIRIGCEVVVILFRIRDHLESIETKLDNDA